MMVWYGRNVKADELSQLVSFAHLALLFINMVQFRIMEDKRKTLRDLEAARTQSLEFLDNLFEKLGESLVSQFETVGQDLSGLISGWDTVVAAGTEADNPPHLWDEKKRLDSEIAESEQTIRDIETDLRHLGELEEIIKRKELEKYEKSKELIRISTDLGQLILSDDKFEHFTSTFEQELKDITLKIDFQQKKLDELDNTDGNILSRLTNGVKGIVAKALLSKNEAALEKLYRLAGEQYLASLDKPDSRQYIDETGSLTDNEIPFLTKKGRELRELQASLNEETEKLRTERRLTADALGQKGNPARRISDLGLFITRTKDEIKRVYCRFGASVHKDEWKDRFSPYFSESDRQLEDKIIALEDSVRDTDEKIKTTKIAIEIDNENAEIARLEKSIEDKRRRIAEAETSISEMEGQITASQKRIGELSEHGEDR